MPMTYTTLGATDQKISSLGLGCMGMSEFYGGTDEKTSIAVLKAAYDTGINFFDTADVYGFGHNEELLGKALKDVRDKIIIATKGSILRKKDDPKVRGVDNSPAYLKAACEASLKRLGIDQIDLYYLHRKDAKVDIETSVGAMAELVKAKKVKYIGLCEVDADTIRRAHKVHPITAVQSEYSLWSREPETDGVLATCRELGISFIPYSPLGRGFLTGNVTNIDALDKDDFRKTLPCFQKDNMAVNMKIVDAVKAMAAAKKCTPAQLSLAWVMAQGKSIGGSVIPIPGTKQLKYLQDNAGSLEVVLDAKDLADLNKVAAPDAVQGERYSAAAMAAYGFKLRKPAAASAAALAPNSAPVLNAAAPAPSPANRIG